jgi:hypothetical protein
MLANNTVLFLTDLGSEYCRVISTEWVLSKL